MFGVNSKKIDSSVLDIEYKPNNKVNKNNEKKVEKKEVINTVDTNEIKNISLKDSIKPKQVNFNIADKKKLENIKSISPEKVEPAPEPKTLLVIKNDNLLSLKKDFPKIHECLKKLSNSSKNDKISIMGILKELKIPQDSYSNLNFEQKWCNSLLKSLSNINSEDQKVFIENLKLNFNSKTMKNGLNKAKNDEILNEFSGNKREVFKNFLELYYTNPVLISGLSSSLDLGQASGIVKNMSQALTLNTDYNNTKSNFGSCQDLQRTVGDIMNQTKDFSNLFDIIKYDQFGGFHNYIIIKDKETKKEYQADPWYSQKLENSIKVRNWTH